MVPQSEGKIFLAGERGHTEQDWFRSYNTFNFGLFQHACKNGFGSLYVLNDDTLAPGRGFVYFMEQDSYVILIPTVGAVRYSDSAGHETVVEAGEAQLHTVGRGTTFEVANPYPDALINVIQVWIRCGEGAQPNATPQLFSFNIEQHKNTLVPVLMQAAAMETSQPNIWIGKFDGRAEAIYTTNRPENGVFYFVLQGAFEVQYRLLEARDGLALRHQPVTEIEALSNDAIILVIETAMR